MTLDHGSAARGKSDLGSALPPALSLIGEVGAELSANPFFHPGRDRRLTRIPSPSEANAARRGAGQIDRAIWRLSP